MFLFVVACSGMSPQEANMVFERANRVGFDAYTTTYADSETATARDSGTFTWTSEEDGFAFEGSVVGTTEWTGQVDLAGSASWTDTTWSGQWSLEYIEVVDEGITLNGRLEWTLDLEGDHTGGSLVYTVYGEIEATGDATGTGLVDYTVTGEITSNSLAFEVEGTIDGTPIDSSKTLTLF